MDIKIDDLCGGAIARFLEEHLNDMRAVSPPESVHALDLERLREPAITFWTMWDEGQLVGCIALKELDATHGEIKSMRVSAHCRNQGLAKKLLHHLIDEAARRGYRRLSLETGSMPFFEPARRLYMNAGFESCAPFGDYIEDPNSVFLSRLILNNSGAPSI
jgi:putative acetyltransferase